MKEIRHGLAALPADLQLRIEEELASLPPEAIVELVVLVGQQALVPATARRAKGEVEGAWDRALGVDQRLDPAIVASKLSDDGRRAIGRGAIDDQHLEIRPVLFQDRLQAGPDVGFFIAGWYDDRHQLRHHKQRRISPTVRSTMTRSSQGDQCSM